MSEIKCPRCKQANPLTKKNCIQCFLPLNTHRLFTFASNVEMQRRRIEDKEDEILLYEDEKMRLFPTKIADEGSYSRRIVYYQNHRFVLLDFFNVIWNRKAVIHFKLRPEKSLILVYPRKHAKCDFFLEILDYLATSLNWELKDIREIFDREMELEKLPKTKMEK